MRRVSWIAAGVGFGAALWWMRRRRWDVRGQVIVITGGSRGLGLEIARVLGARGARLVLCARDTEELDRAATGLRMGGAEVFTHPCNLTEQAEAEALVARVLSEFGRIDGLINNAGMIQSGPVEHMTLEDYRSAMDIHYWAPLYTMLATLPAMRLRRRGHIVNIASIGGKVAIPHLVPYCGSKFALVGLSEGMHTELAKDGIVVTTVCPGLMRTGSHVRAHFKGQNQKEYAIFSAMDANPLVSIDSRRAAREIVAAMEREAAEVILSWPAKVGARAYAMAPGIALTLLGIVNRWLPGPGGIGEKSATGLESLPGGVPAPVTALADEATVRNNEL